MTKGICMRCGKRGKTLIHHKDCNRQNNAITNLIELCPKCHGGWHHGYWDYKSCNLEFAHIKEIPRQFLNRIYLPQNLITAFNQYADEERSKIQNPIVKGLITPEGLMLAALERTVTEAGHFPPRDEVVNTDGTENPT